MRTALPFLLGGYLLATLAAELVLRTLPVATGYDLQAVDAANPILRGTPGFKYVYSRGWNLQLERTGTLNDAGFRASYDYPPDPRSVAVIGNSFIQADAIATADTMTERLGNLLHVPAYAIGVDGFSLADYLAAARWAGERFEARTMLVLLTTGDLTHACSPRPGQHHLHAARGVIANVLIERPEPTPFKLALGESRLFRYIFDNLRASANWAKGWRRSEEEDAGPVVTATGTTCGDVGGYDAAAEFLLHGFRDLESDRNARVIFLLAPGYRREQGFQAGAQRDVDTFADRAESEGFQVVRLGAAFAEALQSGVRLDFMPLDGHWNSTANALAARTVAAALSATTL